MSGKVCFHLFTVFLFLSGCRGDDNPVTFEDSKAIIIGMAVDENGLPLEDVGIHYIPIIVTEAPALSKTNPSTSISFQIPESAIVSLFILRYGTRDTLFYLLKNQQMNTGYHSVQSEMSSLTNGVYLYVLKYNDTIEENKMLLINDPGVLENTIPLTMTDRSGAFLLPVKILGIGESFIRTSETGEIVSEQWISNEFEICLTKTGYYQLKEKLKVTTGREQFYRRFVMKKK